MLSLSKHEDAIEVCAILILRQAQDEEIKIETITQPKSACGDCALL
jgi:hypothetical protein